METEKVVKPLIVEGRVPRHAGRYENLIKGDREINGVYERVKARVVARELPSGERIQPEPLAERLLVSSTPVREALIRLAAERVITKIPKAGFFVKELAESELVDLYNLQGLLLDWSLRTGSKGEGAPRKHLKPPRFINDMREGASVSPQTAVSVIEDLFVHISNRSRNVDVIHIVRNINERTRFVRSKDYEEYGDSEQRLPQLYETYWEHRSDDLREGLKAYFREQVARLPALLRILKMGDF